ncbi:hypothetical protein [Staphylococcus sp. HMSC070D05]|uniref:hypothetical protein n=1 Tax=Staphylococcus sp. HMSC070D05 TaxID=1739538 RepID=UPI0008A5A591|nr:hypothetical protein [Staphylococcus sp. HMSC070D05]OFO40449.1 hypothetical protein HMPREF3046_09240 [Staphylococcus sp. HMSC070D05]
MNRNLLSYENVLNEAISIMQIDFISDIQQKEELFKKYNDISEYIFNSLVINKLLNKLDELDGVSKMSRFEYLEKREEEFNIDAVDDDNELNKFNRYFTHLNLKQLTESMKRGKKLMEVSPFKAISIVNEEQLDSLMAIKWGIPELCHNQLIGEEELIDLNRILKRVNRHLDASAKKLIEKGYIYEIVTDIKYDDLYKLWEYFYKEIKVYKTTRNQIKSIISLEGEYKLAILSELFTLIREYYNTTRSLRMSAKKYKQQVNLMIQMFMNNVIIGIDLPLVSLQIMRGIVKKAKSIKCKKKKIQFLQQAPLMFKHVPEQIYYFKYVINIVFPVKVDKAEQDRLNNLFLEYYKQLKPFRSYDKDFKDKDIKQFYEAIKQLVI